MKIKSRKQREKEYDQKYGKISVDRFTRIQKELGSKFTPELLQAVDYRLKEIKNNVEYERLKFIFYEKPIQSHRPRSAGKLNHMYVPNAKSNKQAIHEFIRDLKVIVKRVVVPMRIVLKAYYPMPNNVNPLEIIAYELEADYAIGKPDFDNVLKAYCDMLIGEIMLDDDLVSSCSFDKYFSLKPRVELDIIYPKGYISEATMKIIQKRKSYKKLINFGTMTTDKSLLVTPYSELKKNIKF